MIFILTGRHCGRDPSIIFTLKATACGMASTVAPIHIMDRIILNSGDLFYLSYSIKIYVIQAQSTWISLRERIILKIWQTYFCPLFWCMVRQRIKYCLVPIDRNGSQGEYRSVYTYILKWRLRKLQSPQEIYYPKRN